MKKLLALCVLALGLYAPVAHAQTPASCGVNFVPSVSVNCANVRAATYVGQILALVPASAATDVACVNASASTNVHIRRVELSGTAGTAIVVPVSLIRRNTVDTGTSTAMNITKGSTANGAAGASGVAYTANPTITDTTSHQTIRISSMQLPLTTGTPVGVAWVFGTAVDAYDQGADLLKGSTQQFCIDLGATTVSTGSLNGIIEWTED